MEGSENPLFAPRNKPSNRPGRSVTREAPLAVASAVISLLIEKKMSEEDAARKVAWIWETHKYELPGTKHSSQSSWKAIAQWRLKLRKGKKSEELLQVYNDAKMNARKHRGGNAAEALLNILDKQYGKKA